MYRIAIVRNGQPVDRRTCQSVIDLYDVVYEVVRAEGGTTTSASSAAISALIDPAQDQADAEGFATLKFGNAVITIRTGPPPADSPTGNAGSPTRRRRDRTAHPRRRPPGR